MPDEGVDLGYCEECGAFGEIFYVDNPGPTRAEQYDQSKYCALHVPLVLSGEDFEMIFEKADVPHPPATLVRQLRALIQGKLL